MKSVGGARAARDPFFDPRPGDVIHHPRFGGGCTFTVSRVFDRKGWGPALGVGLLADDGRIIKPRWRVYALKSWTNFRDDSTVVALAKVDAIDAEASNGQ